MVASVFPFGRSLHFGCEFDQSPDGLSARRKIWLLSAPFEHPRNVYRIYPSAEGHPYSLFCPRTGFRSRTPGPPPFSAMNSIPAASNARRILNSYLPVILSGHPETSSLCMWHDRQTPLRKRSCDHASSGARSFKLPKVDTLYVDNALILILLVSLKRTRQEYTFAGSSAQISRIRLPAAGISSAAPTPGSSWARTMPR